MNRMKRTEVRVSCVHCMRTICLCLFLLMSAVLVTACGGGRESGGPTDDGGSDSPSTDVRDTGEGKEQTDMLILTENGKAVCQPVGVATSHDEAQLINGFLQELGKKTGTVFPLPQDGVTSESERELLFGRVERTDSQVIYRQLGYSDYAVEVVGERVCFCYYDTEGLEKLLAHFLAAVKLVGEGEWGIRRAYAERGGLSEFSGIVPKSGEEDSLRAVLSCGEDNRMAVFEDFSDDAYLSYTEILRGSGFVRLAEHGIAGNSFSVWQKDGCQLTLYRYPGEQTFRLIWGPVGFLPSWEREETEALCAPSITQLGRLAADQSAPNGAPGMGYVLQLSDGRYLLVDGGPVDADGADLQSLMNFLLEHKPATAEKPQIALWIITHAHIDHTGLAAEFLRQYGDAVELEVVAYNFPDFEEISMKEDVSRLAQIATQFKVATKTYAPRARTLILHTGQCFWVGDAQVEILFTSENHAPAVFPTGNHTSIAFRVTLGGQNMLFLGDSEKSNCQYMARVYGETLKSDICQLAHHGVNGGDMTLYRLIDPEICFWAIDENRFLNHPQICGGSAWDYNKWILDDNVRKREHYTASYTTTIPLL